MISGESVEEQVVWDSPQEVEQLFIEVCAGCYRLV